MKRKTALITGINGQDGSYLAKFLLDKKFHVYGLSRRTSNYKFQRLDDDKHIIHHIYFIYIFLL